MAVFRLGECVARGTSPMGVAWAMAMVLAAWAVVLTYLMTFENWRAVRYRWRMWRHRHDPRPAMPPKGGERL